VDTLRQTCHRAHLHPSAIPTFHVRLSLKPFSHVTPEKMKPTVGLTRFFCLMNLCEKKRVSANVYAGFSLFKKVMILTGVKKLFSLQEKRAVFLQ
jgi:hypothetical protein